MRGRRGAARLWMVAMATVAGLTACRDNGLHDRNLPLDDARHRTYGYPVYENVADQRQVSLGGRNWMPSLPIERIPDRLLVPVGSDLGLQLYAVRGAAEPYSRLYTRVGAGEWRPLLRLN